MRIAKVVGQVTLNRCLPSFDGASLKLVLPMMLDEISDAQAHDDSNIAGESIVVWDEYGAGNQSLIAVSEGPEASQPFRPELKPVDAYAAAIIDQLDIQS